MSGSPLSATRPRSGRRHVAARAVAAVAILIAGGPVVALAATIVFAIRPRIAAVRRQRRERGAVAAAYPDFVDLLVLTITSGCTPAQSLAVVAGVAPDAVRPALGHVCHAIATGARFADAVPGLAREAPEGIGPIARPLADALALADRYGTPLGPVLDRLANEARAQRRRNADIAARQLPVRLAFPLVACTLPSFVLLTIVPLMAGTFSSLRGIAP